MAMIRALPKAPGKVPALRYGAMSDEETRRLRAELLRAREDLQHTQERLAYALHQVAELRKRIPGTVTQTAIVDGRCSRAPAGSAGTPVRGSPEVNQSRRSALYPQM